MQDHIDITGASGARYRFRRLREGAPLSSMGGEYVYAKPAGQRFEIVFAGEGRNLMLDAGARWSEACSKFGASELFSRLNVSERVRLQELSDIVAAAHPPMNE
jgi:hypothetical protein